VLRRLTIIALVLCTASTAAGATAEETPPPTLEQACGSTGGLQTRAFWLRTYDRVRLYVTEAGTGKTAIVLAHGGGSDLCETLGVATKLTANGYRVIAFDFRGFGRSGLWRQGPAPFGRDFAAVVAHARRTGAQHVFLAGSSMGGAAVVQNSSSLRVDGRISLSGSRIWRGLGTNNARGLRRIRAPFLYLGSRRDGRAPVKEARDVFRRIAARDKRLVLYPGSEHGWQLIDTSPSAPRRIALVLRWLDSHS
jgi:pimeloyl-ACP methyl ester carboxylesterase